MSKPTIRVGIIGCGKMGTQHIRAINATRGASIVGVADPQADKDSLAELLTPDAVVLTDVSEMLERVRPDAVHIVTPPHTHAPLGRLALTAGCHIYVEKPFTPTRAEAVALFELAAARGLKVCAGHQYLFERPALLAMEALPTIGRLVHAESYFSFRMVRRTITPVDQAKDILPHAVYPLLAQLRSASGVTTGDVEIVGIDVRPEGDVYALVRLGNCTGILTVTLSGRPIEQFQHLVGTNGWLRADYVTGGLTSLPGPGAGLGVLFTPYRRAFQTLARATSGFGRLVFGRTTSYPGLSTLIDRFYASIRTGGPSPLSPQSILDTVGICETIGHRLDDVERATQAAARIQIEHQEGFLPAATSGTVVVTGATGLLGVPVARELRAAGFKVRGVSRRIPRWSARVPGVEYHAGDLAAGLDPALLAGANMVVHCAAETAGGKLEHERNSIAATRRVVEAAAAARVPALVHISSLAVLKPGRDVGGALDEQTPVDVGNLGRGPYVWGKAEAEQLVQRLSRELGVSVKIIRPGPLVDYAAFHPPGRLGRELGPVFVAIGPRRSPLSVCDVGTGARVIRWYAAHFDQAPPILNLVEAPPPHRHELAARMRRDRPDLWFVWMPGWLLRIASGPAKLAQRIALGSKKPIDVYAAFASEQYRTDLARTVIDQAGPSHVHAASDVPQHV